MTQGIGVTLTADDQQLLAILRSVEGKLDHMAASANGAFTQTSNAAARAATQVKALETQTGMTAKGMNAALRTVPAQFADIVTSLQGGQPALQVLLQQGGQLKDTFGGIIPAAKALGGYIWGLVNVYTAAAAAVGSLVIGFAMGREEFARTQRALIMSGDAAGVTASQMQALAATLDDIGGGTQGKAAEVLLQMAAAGVKGASALQSVTNTAIELERAGGPAVEETVKAFAALGKDPVQASIELNKTTNYLTLSLFEQIKALQDQGRATEAAALAQKAYDDELKQRLPAIEAQLGSLQRAWRGVTSFAKETWDAMLGIGRPDATMSKLDSVQKHLDRAKTGIYERNKIPDLHEEVQSLSRKAVREMDIAQAKAAQNEQTQASIRGAQELAKANEMALTPQQKMTREIAQYAKSVEAVRADGGVVDGEQIAKVTAAIVEKYKDRTKAVRTNNQEIEREIALMLKLSGFSTGYAQDAAMIDSLAAKGKITRERALQLQRELLDMQPGIKAAAQQEVKALQDAAAAAREQQQEIANYFVAESKAREQASLATFAYSKSVDDAGAALEFETSLLGATREEREKRIAQYKVEIALREKLAAIDRTFGTDPAGDMERARVREAAAKEIAQIEGRAYLNEWQRTWDSLADGLTDALIRGFSNGGEAVKDLKKVIERTLRTVVVKPMVENAVKSILGSVQIWVGQAFDAARGGSIANGAGGRGGTLTDLLSVFGIGSFNAGAAVSNAAVYSGVAYNTGFGSQQSQMLAAQELGMTSGAGTAGIGASVSAAMPYIAAAVTASKFIQKYQSEGFGGNSARRAFGGSSLTTLSPGPIFAEISQGLQKLGVSGKWADILSGSTAFSKLFGRAAPKTTDQGISGTIGGGQASLQAFQDWRAKGGLFRSDKTGTNTAALEQAQQAALNESAKGVYDAVLEWAGVLKLPATQLAAVTQSVRVSLGNDGEKNAEAIAKVMTDYRDALANSLGPAIEPLRKFGESAAEALERLSTLQTFSNDLNSLGGVFSRLSGLSVNARESFIGMVGGMEALRSQAKSFVENFYSRDEVAGIKAREIQDALRAVGITGDVSTREQFRSLVDGSDINTEAGRLQLATLLQAQGSFVDVADYLQEVGGSLSSLAQAAPQMGALGGILSAPEQAQIDAINSVTSAVNEVRDAIVDLGQNRGSQGSAGYPSSTWEVTIDQRSDIERNGT